jgi:hypothetical protein
VKMSRRAWLRDQKVADGEVKETVTTLAD